MKRAKRDIHTYITYIIFVDIVGMPKASINVALLII